MAVPSDHAYSDKHGHVSSWLRRRNVKKKKYIYKSSVKPLLHRPVALRGLSKEDADKGPNTEPGIAKPVAPFHHSHRAAVNNLLRINTPLVTNVIIIIQTGSYEAHKPNNLNKK